MNIKKASELLGISADTIRYYERVGIVPPITRNDNGIRNFTERDLGWLEFAKHYRNAGMSIEKLEEYIKLFSEGDITIPARIELLEEEYDRLIEKRDEINEHLNRLEYKIQSYRSSSILCESLLKKLEKGENNGTI